MPAPSFGRVFVLPLVLAVVGLGLLALVLRPSPDTDRSNAEAQARARQHAIQLAAQTVALGEARTALAAHQITTTRVVSHYQTLRDTLTITDTLQVKVFVARADSVVRACTELAESCAVFRVRADSLIGGLTVDRDLWKGIAESQKPSKWAPVREWAIRIGIGYGAFKLGQAAR